MFATVAYRLIAPTIELMPVRWIRKIHASTPCEGRYCDSFSGAYHVHPHSGGEKNSEL
jgi:hypothetical protein